MCGWQVLKAATASHHADYSGWDGLRCSTKSHLFYVARDHPHM